ncbi:MAG: hypothetical protein NVSMB16_09620 [Acidimicrobiales bacterium]
MGGDGDDETSILTGRATTNPVHRLKRAYPCCSYPHGFNALRGERLVRREPTSEYVDAVPQTLHPAHIGPPGYLRRCARAVFAPVDPTRHIVASRLHDVPTPGARVGCVYRYSNASHVLPLLREAVTCGWSVRLWALDAIHPDLASWTVGVGAGGRFANLNKLVCDAPPSDYLILVDDDIALRRGSFGALGRISALLDLDFAQPAHARGSHFSHWYTKQVLGSVARFGNFVEIGPMVMIGPRFREEVVPFATHGMGWGVELEWSKLAAKGARLAIVDAFPMRHLAPIAESYDSGAEGESMRRHMSDEGVTDWSDFQRAHTLIRPWPRLRGDSFAVPIRSLRLWEPEAPRTTG